MSRRTRKPSDYETTKRLHEGLQKKIVAETGKTEQLADELSMAAHSHASRQQRSLGKAFAPDCERGCASCCYQPATVFPFEALRIARLLKTSLSEKELESLAVKMKARVKGFKGASVRANVNNKTACPLLVDGECSVYADRPLTCRMAHSFSLKQCHLSFQKDRTQVEIPMSLEFLTGISGIIEATYEELPAQNLDAGLYELCSAVLAALADPNAATKWAGGDKRVFKSCIKDDT